MLHFSEGAALLLCGCNTMAVMENIVWVPGSFYSGQTRVVRPPIALPWNQKRVDSDFHTVRTADVQIRPKCSHQQTYSNEHYTKGQASITAGGVGVLELRYLWHRIFWQLALQLSDSLQFLLKSRLSSLHLITIFVFYLGTFWVTVSEKTAEVPLKDSKLRTYGNLDMETSN